MDILKGEEQRIVMVEEEEEFGDEEEKEITREEMIKRLKKLKSEKLPIYLFIYICMYI